MAWKPDYVTVAQLRDFMRITHANDDNEIGFAVTAASRAIDKATGRQFGQVDAAEERRYTAEWNRHRGRWVLEFDDVQDITGLTVEVDGTAVTGYTLEPVNAAAEGKPYEGLAFDKGVTATAEEYAVTVTALFGWTAVPTDVVEATLLQGSRFHWRRSAPGGVAGSPDTGSEVRLLDRVDPDVAVSLGDVKRWWWAA